MICALLILYLPDVEREKNCVYNLDMLENLDQYGYY
jgi:hypothetical protein